MIKTISKAAFAVVLGLGLVTAQAEEQHAVIVKIGSYSLSETSQNFSSSITTFTEDSDSELSIEYERNMGNNLSMGGELTLFSNKITNGASQGEADASLVMFNVKKYFDVANNFKAFVGGGIGAASVDLTGDFYGTGSDIGLQLMGGVEYRIQQFGLYAEYKIVSAEPEDDAGTPIDISGSGIFFGGAVHF